MGCLSALAFLYSHFMHSIFGTPEPSFFSFFFDHTCIFYLVITYKCEKTVFPTSSTIILSDHVRNFAVGTWIYPHVVVTTERVCVRSGLPVCTCLSALAFCTCLSSLSLCTSLFALHSVLTPHSTFLVYFLRTSLRRMSFEMIGFGETPYHAGQRLCSFTLSFFVSFFASIFGVIFDGFWLHFWITFWMSFHILALFFRACFWYRFFIEFRMDFGLIFDVFLIPLPFAHATF